MPEVTIDGLTIELSDKAHADYQRLSAKDELTQADIKACNKLFQTLTAPQHMHYLATALAEKFVDHDDAKMFCILMVAKLQTSRGRSISEPSQPTAMLFSSPKASSSRSLGASPERAVGALPLSQMLRYWQDKMCLHAYSPLQNLKK